MEENIGWSSTHTCLDCGQEVLNGIFNYCKHSIECKRDAPNENIELHHIQEKYKEIAKKKDDRLNAIYPKMTLDEQGQLLLYSMSGMLDVKNNTVMMGMDAFRRLDDYREQMIAKYS